MVAVMAMAVAAIATAVVPVIRRLLKVRRLAVATM
jgi:hypothetical protein